MLALASVLLVVGFAAGQAAPNVVDAIGGALDSGQAQSFVAPELVQRPGPGR
jgi:hypothetical protein